MLESIHLKNVGPAPKMEMDLAPRLNLITGDNGLGKSFLLDVAWWALTRTWARGMAIPRRVSSAFKLPNGKRLQGPAVHGAGTIEYAYSKKTAGLYKKTSTFDRERERWSSDPGRPPIPGLILYAQVDGAFSVWDPARNYWKDEKPDRPSAFMFTPEQVWRGNAYCKGLLDDWALWQAGNDPSFHVLKHVIEALSPSSSDKLVPGDLRKLTASDPQRYPTLRMPYGEDVPVTQASAGMRRVLAIAYLLTWAWQEHRESAELRGEKPAREIVFLIDEIEGHLHPQWQRRIVPALLKVMDALTGQHGSRVQLIAATHSPLVLASVEPTFDAGEDAWFDLDLENKQVVLRRRPFSRFGEVDNWLTSDAFDLGSARSVEAEEVLERAARLLSATNVDPKAVKRIETELHQVLGPEDRFWVRWRFVGERKGWLKSMGRAKLARTK